MKQDERDALCDVVNKLTILIKETRDFSRVCEYVTPLKEIGAKLAPAATAGQ